MKDRADIHSLIIKDKVSEYIYGANCMVMQIVVITSMTVFLAPNFGSRHGQCSSVLGLLLPRATGV